MNEKRFPVATRGQTLGNDEKDRPETRIDRLLPWIVILTLVLGIAAMLVDYIWNAPPNDVTPESSLSPQL